MEKINIAELLKDCPKGMELDCTIWDSEAKVFLKRVLNDDFAYPIEVTVKYNNTECTKSFTKYGAFNDLSYCKCVIFPKGKTTWEGFQIPFKVGDIVFTTLGNIAIIRKPIGGELFYVYGVMVGNGFYKDETSQVVVERLATEEEKAKLFKALKERGYKWNPETNTLEKSIIPQFKVGDKITFRCEEDKPIISITGVKGNYYLVQYFNIIKGDYQNEKISFEFQDNYKLVPDKFDITTLKPFDKVLVKTTHYDEVWSAAIFSHINADYFLRFWTTAGRNYEQCIPFMGNEHLLGTNDDCDEYFKTWK